MALPPVTSIPTSREKFIKRKNLQHHPILSISKVKKGESLSTPTTSSEDTLKIIDLPAKNSGALMMPDRHQMAVIVNDESKVTGKVLVYNYETGKLEHTFETNNQIMNLNKHGDTLFVQVYNAWKIRAWDLNTGKEKTLPPTWDRVDAMCCGEKFIAHNNFEDNDIRLDKNKAITFIISDPTTLKPINKVQSSFFSFIHGMIIEDDKLFVMGAEENECANRGTIWWSSVTRYDRPFDENYRIKKASFVNDANSYSSDAFRIEDGTVYNSSIFTSVNTFWSADTLSPMLEKKRDGKAGERSLSALLDDKAVIFTSKNMEIYQKKENQFLPIKTIEWEKNDVGVSIEIFNYSNTKVSAEGYRSGIVRIRNLETSVVMMEFSPPDGLEGVLSTRFHNDKLVVQYSVASKDKGTLAILWDLKQQEAQLFIRRESLKGRDYNARSDQMNIVGEDIIVLSEDQSLIYKKAFTHQQL